MSSNGNSQEQQLVDLLFTLLDPEIEITQQMLDEFLSNYQDIYLICENNKISSKQLNNLKEKISNSNDINVCNSQEMLNELIEKLESSYLNVEDEKISVDSLDMQPPFVEISGGQNSNSNGSQLSYGTFNLSSGNPQSKLNYSSDEESLINNQPRHSGRGNISHNLRFLDDSSDEESSINDHNRNFSSRTFPYNLGSSDDSSEKMSIPRNSSSHKASSLRSSRSRGIDAHGYNRPPENVDIYAHLNLPKAETSNQYDINSTVNKLHQSDLSKYHSKTGLNVYAPNSGESFNLKNYPRGITHATYTPNKHAHPTDEVLALTIMNMVENVISKGNPLNLHTNDVFVVEIVRLYVDVLKDKELNIDYNPPQVTIKDPTRVKNAKDAFETIMNSMKIEDKLDISCPWYEAALEKCGPQQNFVPRI